MSFQTEQNRSQPMFDGLNAAIRENPLAAGLIGAGIAWILMGGTKGMGVLTGAAKGAAAMSGTAAASAGAGIASAGARAGSGVVSTASQAASGIKDAVSRVSGAITSIVPDLSAGDDAIAAAQDVKSGAGDRLRPAVDTGRNYGRVLQSRLSESLDQQPLLLGAIGLVIGAGVASAFATTSIERDLMGEQGTAARDKLNDIAGQAKDLAAKVVNNVKEEAAKQGFTVDAATNAASEMVEKAKRVASDMPGIES